MDQKQLDDLESREREEDLSGANDDFSDDELESAEEEEKMNDVNEIINNQKEEIREEKVEEVKIEGEMEEKKSVSLEPEKRNEDDFDWDDEEKTEKSGSGWKYLTGILVILLAVSIYTQGFHFSGITGTTITQIDAEETVVDYVNNNLLRPPFTAEAKSSEELPNLFKVTIDVAGQEVDSYMTKDGKYFFPQGFNLGEDSEPIVGEETELGDTEEEETLFEVSIDNDPMKGDVGAPVTIIEFSEFQCPFCKKYVDGAYGQIMKDYVETGKVRYVFRDFPLGFHERAKPAAMAAECANEQGKFWEYHDLLFENQAELGGENYKKWAKELGLSEDQFNECLDSEKYSGEVDQDMADGQTYGVSGTPAFFINGKLLSGAQPYAAFKVAIDEAFSKSGESTEIEVQIDEVAEEVEEVLEEEEAPTEMASPETKEITVGAKKWRFVPNNLEVGLGDTVKLLLSSLDVEHSFELSGFGLSEVIPAGETVEVEFVANKAGTFPFTSKSNAVMSGNLVVK